MRALHGAGTLSSRDALAPVAPWAYELPQQPPRAPYLTLKFLVHRCALAVACCMLAPAAAHAAEPPSPVEQPAADPRPTRSVWLAPTYQVLFTDAFEPSSRHAPGFGLSYEFHISPKFNLGLATAYRIYPGQQVTQQLGYGAVLKHFFSGNWSTLNGAYPYLDYGLLLQQTYVEGRKGSAVSHDTRLGTGLLVRTSGIPFFLGAAFHYSRLSAFGTDSKLIPYLDVQLGVAPAF